MLKKIINIAVLAPIGIVLIVLSVANRQPVRLALNPFRPEDTVLSMTAPFFVYLFLALILGIVLGAIVAWISQHKYRKQARSEAGEAVKWQTEADRQKARAETLQAQSLLSAPK